MGITEIIIIGVMLGVTFLFPKEGFDMPDQTPKGKCPDCGAEFYLGGGFGAHKQAGCLGPGSVTEDRLTRMWGQQEEFMRLLQEKRGFPQFPADLGSKKGQQFLKDIRNHLMEELYEAGQHLKNAKSHRATDIPEVDREAYKEELVDALHLYIELVIASGISLEELVDAYLKKGDVNTRRIMGGY